MAHPDDETIALGGRLARLRGIRMLHVTDGAPERMEDAHSHGFATRKEYAAARAGELAAVLAQAGVPVEACASFGIPDQAAARRLAEIAMRLADLLRAQCASAILTHALEGGHPDHDTVAVAVRAACALLRREGREAPAVLEFPLYHSRNGEWVAQRFAPEPCAPDNGFPLDAAERATKALMLAAFTTQRATLATFAEPVERFRSAPVQEIAAVPNGGDLLYARFDWGLAPEGWRAAVKAAQGALDLPAWL